jgi:hypothetical protein
VASRVERGAALPEVEVSGLRKARNGIGEVRITRAVVGHVVEGLRSELIRELVEEVAGM